jgi:4'-phosphopantetheinyl transferase
MNLIDCSPGSLPASHSKPRLSLATGDCHIWIADLRTPGMASSLSHDERERAHGYLSDTVRRRFIAGRMILRSLCASYVGQPAASIRLKYSESGKPSLADNPLSIQFNLSHTGDTALFAFTLKYVVGIDVEAVSPTIDVHAIARQFLSHDERQALENLPLNEQCGYFFECWTRREALSKATGQGLYDTLDQRSTTMEHLSNTGTVFSFVPAPNHRACLATANAAPTLSFFRLNGLPQHHPDGQGAISCKLPSLPPRQNECSSSAEESRV